MSHFPAGTSLKSLLHFKQLISRKKFEEYDHGPEENLKRYGQKHAPSLDISKIEDFPIALFAGVEDKLASIVDVRWLKERLDIQGSLIFYEEY